MRMPREYPIRTMLERIERATAAFPKAAMFQLRERGFTSLFQQLVSCAISIRTLDEVSLPLSLALFERAPDAASVLALPEQDLIDLLHGSMYPGQKAATIRAIAEADLAGKLRPEFESLTAIKGIGPKCANLALGVSSGHAAISVDIHVHRVTNRWGLVRTTTPEKTMTALEAAVPRDLWTDINRVLMPFGKHLCTGTLPRCSDCPVYEWCERVGVGKHR